MNKHLIVIISKWISQNATVIIFACLVGVLSVAPHFLAVKAIGENYKGVPFLYTNNEDYYLARINEIANGHPMVASPYFYEYKGSSSLVPPIGEYFYYALSRFLFLSLPQTLVLAKFLFPAILFLLVFVLIRKFLPEEIPSGKLTAIMGGLFVSLGYDLIDYHLLISRLGGSTQEILSLWTRPVNPITGALILFSFLILLFSIVKEKENRYTPFIAGILLALSVGYIFTFGIAFAVLAVLLVIFVVKKNLKIVKNLSLALITGGLIDSIYFLSIWKTVATGGDEVALRNGMLLTHTPILNKVLIVAIILFVAVSLFLHFKKRLSLEEPWFIFGSSLLLGGLITFNQQIITGKTIWPYHFVQYTIPIAIIVSLVTFFYLIAPRLPKLWKMFMVSLVCLFVAFGIWNAYTYKYLLNDFISLQKYEKIFTWLNENAPYDSVVLVKETGERLTRLIPAFTSSNVYVTTYLSNTMPRERIFHNYQMKLRLNDVSVKNVRKYLAENEIDAREFFYTDWQMLFAKNRDPRILPVLEEIAKTYEQTVKKDFEMDLKQYRIDYIITENTPDSDTKKLLPLAEKVFETDAFKIYKI